MDKMFKHFIGTAMLDRKKKSDIVIYSNPLPYHGSPVVVYDLSLWLFCIYNIIYTNFKNNFKNI